MEPAPAQGLALGDCDSSSNCSDDCGDWTLVSPPHSSSSSSSSTPPSLKREELESSLEEPKEQQEDSNGGQDHLTEIDLTAGPSTVKEIDDDLLRTQEVKEEDDRSSTEPIIPGFQALDTTDDDEQNSGRLSLTQSELGEYVDLGQRSTDSLETMMQDGSESEMNTTASFDKVAIKTAPKQESLLETQPMNISDDEHNDVDRNSSLCSKEKVDELSKILRYRKTEVYPIRPLYLVLIMLWLLVILGSLVEIREKESEKTKHSSRSDSESSKAVNPRGLNHASSIPFNQLKELQSLQDELTKCIKRQSPTSYKYYMSEERFKGETESRQRTSKKSIRGLVCYGQENRWRDRFNQLKENFKLDLRKLVQEAKNQISSDMLESHHPTLKFKLILSQMEYLDFLENKRNKKQQEEVVKFLKAENLLLLHRLNQPNETGYSKSLINLELENSRLKRENEALKVNLVGKAGPTYIKQSLELEQYERENVILKQFHHQVAKEVAKSLRQFNLHTIDASTSLDDEESLNSQLMLTRGYLHRLSEKISTVLIENEGLKEELKEAYTSSKAIGKLLLPITSKEVHDIIKLFNVNSNSNGLVADSCIRKLMELTEKFNHQLEEWEKEAAKKHNCQANSNVVDLERCSERHLNLATANKTQIPFSVGDLKQLVTETGLDKRITDALTSLRQDENIVDELMVFLTKFNNQFESNEIATAQAGIHEVVHDSYKGEEHLNKLVGSETEVDTIPIYIRETVRDNKKIEEPEADAKLQEIESQVSFVNQPGYIESQENEEHVGVHSDIISDDDKSMKNLELESTEANNSKQESYTWFSARAKQRKQLRKKDSYVLSSTWSIKRAKLREKLRKAGQFIDKFRLKSKKSMFKDKPSSARKHQETSDRSGVPQSGRGSGGARKVSSDRREGYMKRTSMYSAESKFKDEL